MFLKTGPVQIPFKACVSCFGGMPLPKNLESGITELLLKAGQVKLLKRFVVNPTFGLNPHTFNTLH